MRVSTGNTPLQGDQPASAARWAVEVSFTLAEASSISISTSAIWAISASLAGLSFTARPA